MIRPVKLAIGGAAAVALVLWLAFRRPDPAPLPPKLERELTRREVTRTIDSTVIRQLRTEADQAKRAATAAIARASSATSAADVQRRRADSLATVARKADSIAGNSGIVSPNAPAVPSDPANVPPWRAAYEASRAEADTLRGALALTDSAFRFQRTRADLLVVALDRSDSSHARDIALLNDVITQARRRQPPCRVARLIPCPSRKVSAVAGAGAALLVTFRSRIHIP